MTVSTLILVLLFLSLIFLFYLLKLFRDDLRSLQNNLSATKDTIHTSLAGNTRDITDRLTRATEVIGELKKEAGAFTEVSRSMKDLHDFLQSPKLRGNIGELVLSDLISQIFPKSSYQLQYRFHSGDRVDAVIKTDAGLLCIDSKFPLTNYQALLRAPATEQPTVRRAFSQDIKTHLSSISHKYILPAENTLDFALMYVPSESVFYELAQDAMLMELARSLRVYPVSPNTLYAALQTILLSFEGKKIESRAKEVFKLLRGLQKDMTKTSTSLSTLGSHLTNAYNKFSDVQSSFIQIEQKMTSSQTLAEPEKPRISA